MNTEAELIARCRGGDPGAWDELFDKYYGVVARFVFQLSHNFSHEDTEEICQETFLAVIKGIASFQGQSAFQTWLLRVATNKAMDFREKAGAAKRGGGIAPISLHASDASDDPPLDPPSAHPGPDAVLVNFETGALVRQSLDQLDAPCREIIELRYYGDLSYEEIAGTLKLNPKTVSSRLSKCLDRLGAIAKKIFARENSFTV
jgi:RNA polymerase sigma-70 factor (ECF subfamily)